MFVQLKDYPDYLITDDGKVISLKFGKWRERKPCEDSNGYLRVALCGNGSSKKLLVHRLVAQTFIPNPLNKPDVNHIRGDKTDNRAEMLEWITKHENQEHAWKTGLHENTREAARNLAGEKHGRAKLSDTQAAELLALKGTMPQREAATLFGIGQMQVCNIWNGKSRKHLHPKS